MVSYERKPASAKSALSRVREVDNSASDYEAAFKQAGIKPEAYEVVFGLMVRFCDFPPNEIQFKKDAASSSRFIARRFLKMFGERVWGNDRKYIRSGLLNGGLRYTLAKLDRHVGKLVDTVASAFRAMQRKIFRPVVSIQRQNLRVEATRTDEAQEKAATVDGEATFSSEEDDEDGNSEIEEGKEDANDSAEDEEEDDENQPEEGGADAGPSRRRQLQKKSHMSRTVEYEEGEATDEEHDSSNRLRNLEARRASTRQADDDMPYDFDRPVRGVTSGQQQAIDGSIVQLSRTKRTDPAMYHHLCLQVLRHYRDGRPI